MTDYAERGRKGKEERRENAMQIFHLETNLIYGNIKPEDKHIIITCDRLHYIREGRRERQIK